MNKTSNSSLQQQCTIVAYKVPRSGQKGGCDRVGRTIGQTALRRHSPQPGFRQQTKTVLAADVCLIF